MPRNILYVCVALLSALLIVVWVRTAWVSDDAFITFRTIDNALHGYGLRWNPAERVQSFTHPLWLLLLMPVVALTGNPFLSSIALSLALSAVSVAFVLAMCGPRTLGAVFALAAMVLSKSFVDYSSSGLENPLSHALLAALMFVTTTPVRDRWRAVVVGLLVGLVGMTRTDLLLLAVPLGLAGLRAPRQTLVPFALGLAPLGLWEVFSVIYYGVPFPNTAYAKLATGIPQGELFVQGGIYVLDSLNRDPITLFVIGAAIVTTWATGGSRVAVLAIALYLAYVVRIGGDFMSTRFFSAPFVVSLALLARAPEPRSWLLRTLPLAGVLAFGLATAQPTIVSGSAYDSPWHKVISDTGIVDERGFRFSTASWLGRDGFRNWPDMIRVLPRIDRVRASGVRAITHDQVGLDGYLLGPEYHIVDVWALNDPLLARLPTNIPWRIGHYQREQPLGYFDSVVEDRNVIADPRIASLYEVIRVVTRDPLWSWQRWRAIAALNTSRTDGWPVRAQSR